MGTGHVSRTSRELSNHPFAWRLFRRRRAIQSRPRLRRRGAPDQYRFGHDLRRQRGAKLPLLIGVSEAGDRPAISTPWQIAMLLVDHMDERRFDEPLLLPSPLRLIAVPRTMEG